MVRSDWRLFNFFSYVFLFSTFCLVLIHTKWIFIVCNSFKCWNSNFILIIFRITIEKRQVARSFVWKLHPPQGLKVSHFFFSSYFLFVFNNNRVIFPLDSTFIFYFFLKSNSITFLFHFHILLLYFSTAKNRLKSKKNVQHLIMEFHSKTFHGKHLNTREMPTKKKIIK